MSAKRAPVDLAKAATAARTTTAVERGRRTADQPLTTSSIQPSAATADGKPRVVMAQSAT